jgi:hypothetical protein
VTPAVGRIAHLAVIGPVKDHNASEHHTRNGLSVSLTVTSYNFRFLFNHGALLASHPRWLSEVLECSTIRFAA